MVLGMSPAPRGPSGPLAVLSTFGHGPPGQRCPVARSVHTTFGDVAPRGWKMFQAWNVPPGVRYRIGVKPSPPVAAVTARTGGVSEADSDVASGPASGLLAR